MLFLLIDFHIIILKASSFMQSQFVSSHGMHSRRGILSKIMCGYRISGNIQYPTVVWWTCRTSWPVRPYTFGTRTLLHQSTLRGLRSWAAELTADQQHHELEHLWHNIYISTCNLCFVTENVSSSVSESVMLLVRQTFCSSRKSRPSVFDIIRSFSDKGNCDIGEDLVELMHGRKNLERRDSVNDDILLERQKHQLRIQNIAVDKSDVRLLSSLGIGSKKRQHSVYKITFNQFIDVEEGSYKKSQTGSGDDLRFAFDSYN